MKFWIPVVSKWQPKQYKTLADVPEGIACVVVYGDTEYLVRQRRGLFAYRFCGNLQNEYTGSADKYTFIRTLDPLPEQKVSITDLPDGRCFTAGKDTTHWKSGELIYWQNPCGIGSLHRHSFNLQADIRILDIEMQLQDFPETQSN